MATLAIENTKIELISTNVVDSTTDNYVCGTSPDGNYRGKIGSLFGATDPNWIYSIVKSEEKQDYSYNVTSKYFYKLFTGDIIHRNNKWYKVIKNIDLSYGANQDNSTYDKVEIAEVLHTWTDKQTKDTPQEFDWQTVKNRVILENGNYNVYTIYFNNQSGEWKEVSRSLTDSYPNKLQILDSLPTKEQTFITLPTIDENTQWKRVTTYKTLPSLPPYTSITYYKELLPFYISTKCESYKVHPVNEMLPFDELNTSYATKDNEMRYKIKSLKKFNAFTLAGVTASTLEYKIKDVDGNTVKEEILSIDCKLDDDGLLEKGTTTILITTDEVVAKGGTIEIVLRNDGEVKLGSFFTNIAIDEGQTSYNIKLDIRDYNDYTPDSWGQIAPAVKAKTKMCKIEVIVPYDKFNHTNARHKKYQGKFVTLDATDANINKNEFTLTTATMRGIIINVLPEILLDSGKPSQHYKYTMNFLEVV